MLGVHDADGDAAARTAMAFSNQVDGTELTFSASRGEIVDAETGSVRRVDGVAVSGPLTDVRLEPVAEA